MPRKLTVLDRVNVSSPCKADWNEMKGNDVVRFCEHCNLNVTDLSSMTRTKATKLVLKSKGRLCVRYTRNPDGAIQTATQKVYQISRRASRITAGVFSAALTLSATTFAQVEPARLNVKENIVMGETLKQKQNHKATASLKGVIKDINDAIIQGASLMLKNKKTGEELITATDEDGTYNFASLAEGSYKLTAKAPGFAQDEGDVFLIEGRTKEFNVRLNIEVGMMGDVVIIKYENPLLNAALQEDMETIQYLLTKGYNINVKEGDETALHIAVARNNIEMVRFLINAGADPNIKNKDGIPPLGMMDEESSIDILKLLIESGANVNIKGGEEGQTLLMGIAEEGDAEVLQMIIDKGAKINQTDDNGRTALMYAVENEKIENVKVLLKVGADVLKRDKEGVTALQLAVESGNQEIIRLLKSYGAY